MTSNTYEWVTPQSLYDALNAEFGPFTLDPCATSDTAKCERYYTLAEDGLVQPWEGRVFMNPPYGRTIGLWIRKAALETQKGALVVCLLPARTDTKAWHEWVFPYATEIRFLRGRVHFSNAGRVGPAPFPSAVVVFSPHGRQGPIQTAPRGTRPPPCATPAPEAPQMAPSEALS